MNNLENIYSLSPEIINLSEDDKKELVSTFNNLLFFQNFMWISDMDIATDDDFKLVYKGDFRTGQEIEASDYMTALEKRFSPDSPHYSSWKHILDHAHKTIQDKVSKELIDGLILYVLQDHQRRELFETGDVDFSVWRKWANYRLNVAFIELDNGGLWVSFTIRKLKKTPFTIQEMNLNKTILDHFNTAWWLILVSWPTWSAKSSTLTTILDHINKTKNKKIVTLEDPVEFFWSGLQKNSTFRQREVWKTVESFATWIRAAMRQAPDIIVIWEMRDRETVQMATEAAWTWHLVISTVHVSSVRETLDRLLWFFDGAERSGIQQKLSASLKLVMNQRLVSCEDGSRVVAYEWLDCTADWISQLIKNNNLNDVKNKMYTLDENGRNPHKPLNESLYELICEGKLATTRWAEEYSNDPAIFDENLKIYIETYVATRSVSREDLTRRILTTEQEYRLKEQKKREWEIVYREAE